MPQATRPLASVPPPLQEGLDSGWVLTASFMQPRLPYLCSVFAGPLHSFQTGLGLHSSGYIDPPQGAGEVEKLLPDVSLSVVYQRTWLWGGIVHCLGILLFGCLGFGLGRSQTDTTERFYFLFTFLFCHICTRSCDVSKCRKSGMFGTTWRRSFRKLGKSEFFPQHSSDYKGRTLIC